MPHMSVLKRSGVALAGEPVGSGFAPSRSLGLGGERPSVDHPVGVAERTKLSGVEQLQLQAGAVKSVETTIDQTRVGDGN